MPLPLVLLTRAKSNHLITGPFVVVFEFVIVFVVVCVVVFALSGGVGSAVVVVFIVVFALSGSVGFAVDPDSGSHGQNRINELPGLSQLSS